MTSAFLRSDVLFNVDIRIGKNNENPSDRNNIHKTTNNRTKSAK